MTFSFHDNDIMAMFDQGLEAHTAGQLSAAEKVYRDILKIQSDHPEANHNIGALLVARNEFDDALIFFKFALESSPNVSLFWASYIDNLVNLERISEATSLINIVKKSDLFCENIATTAQRLAVEYPDSSIQKFTGIEWGIFSLIEFIVSESNEIGKRYKTAIDIGSGAGVQSEILRAAGLEVFQLDKYSDTADYKVDFVSHTFDQKFDVVYCSHVIEHQRNVGNFLDKIFDIMSEDGVLIISAPKHPAEYLTEGHLNCFFKGYFIQHLIHAGFDLKQGKYLSAYWVENAAIVSKAKNFDLVEREEDGYLWTDKHKQRSFVDLKNHELIENISYFHNCQVFSAPGGDLIQMNFPKNYKCHGIEINSERWDLRITI